jgi:hypothetical protein
MRKGPVPAKAIGVALPAALVRGFVVLCQRNTSSEIDLIIAGPGLTAIVCICRTKTLNESPEVLEAQFGNLIAVLRRVPHCPGRSCEIWACDYYGNVRFFRLKKEGIEEIGRDGNPLGGPG